ncbi:MAG: winged helix-turn-helix transcriptional regulator [Desulfurococcales archaeon]|nr:winged helix-turn-helix transcriptional regulator [Desulfurococcales archaeon]
MYYVFKHPVDQMLHDEDTLGYALILGLSRGCKSFWELKDLMGENYSYYDISEALRRLSRQGLVTRKKVEGIAATRLLFCLTREGRKLVPKARSFFKEVAAAAKAIARDIRREMDSPTSYKVLPDIAGFLYRMKLIRRRDYDMLTNEPDYDDLFIEIDPSVEEELQKDIIDASAF